MAEPVIIAEYDPAWPERFRSESERIAEALGDLLKTIDHVGSTSVTGLAAKPVIDINVGLHSADDLDRTVPIFGSIGYRYVPDFEDEFPNRRLFERFVEGAWTFHAHVVDWESDFRKKHLLFRDLLRDRKDMAWAYTELKKGLALTYRDDRLAYNEAKTEFIECVLDIANKEGMGSRSEEGMKEC